MFKAVEYVKVRTLEEAWELNQKKSNMIIGGMLWLKMENVNKRTLIDLSRLGLDEIEEKEDGFYIGCMTSLRQLETDERLNDYFQGIFRECTRHIVGVQFRNCATVGGSIWGRYGFSDLLTCMMALDTHVELYKGGIVSLKEFAEHPADNDILVRIIIRKDGRKAAYTTQRRSATDFPVIACCVAKKENTWYASVGARPARAQVTESKICDGMTLKDMAEDAAACFRYGSNMRGSGEYRKELAAIYLRRLMEQIERTE